MSKISELKKELKSLSNPQKIKIYKNFHKTQEGTYAHGEVFLGVTVPQLSILAKKYYENISLDEISNLLDSNIHEEKYIAVIILVKKYKSNVPDRNIIFDFCINNASRMSGWDLVDSMAHQIVGHYLYWCGKDHPIYKILLTNLAKSDNIWQKRIAIISTYYFIKQKEFDETIKIAEILLKDKHDLIQKAVGWMLREAGKRDLNVLKGFLKKHYKIMPRTMLRYSIEKFSKKERKAYLKGEI